jgi:hypothetical protein
VRQRLVAVLAAAVLGITACGGSDSSSSGDPDEEEEFSAAADRSTCVADATPVESFPDGYPADFPLPPNTVAYDAEDRGEEGVVVTGVTDLPFQEVLSALNGPAQDAGFKVTSGETEEHDAEANWKGNGYRGRWAIRESSECRGETVVQVLAAADPAH